MPQLSRTQLSTSATLPRLHGRITIILDCITFNESILMLVWKCGKCQVGQEHTVGHSAGPVAAGNAGEGFILLAEALASLSL